MSMQGKVKASATVLIVGAGQSGACTAAALRDAGWKGPVVLLGEEPHLPYERPQLSKQALSGTSVEALFREEFYEEKRIALRLGVRVETIDRAASQVVLASGERIGYEYLVLATGLRTRLLRGFDLGDRLFHLRTRDDAQRLRGALRPGLRVLVVGGGLLGLELAATTRQVGCEVTVVERLPSVLYQSVAPVVGEYVSSMHVGEGVRIRTNQKVVEMSRDEHGPVRVVLSNGDTLTTDIVIAATGSTINSELAEACGIDVQDGVIVDEYGRSSDPRIFAVGDVARHYNVALRRTIRVESWHNARNQSVAAARAIAGVPQPYAEVPWFWSDQFGMNLQIVGYSSDWDGIVVRGETSARRFSVFYLRGDRVVAANLINNGRDTRPARELVKNALPVDRNLLAEERVPLGNVTLSASASAG